MKCGQTDSHAHHVQYVTTMYPGTNQPLDLVLTKHIQCCAEDGCQICAVTVAQVTSPEIGDSFDQVLQTPSSDYLHVLFEKVAVESPDFNIPSTQEASA